MQQNIICKNTTPLREVVKLIDQSSCGMAIVVDAHDVFIGIMTNGDVYQAIFSGAVLDTSVEKYCNRTPIIVRQSELEDKNVLQERTKDLLARRGIWVPVLDEDMHVVDLKHYTELEEGKSSVPMPSAGKRNVLIVGGAGYFGSVMAERMLDRGYGVRILDNFTVGNEHVFDTFKSPNLDVIRGDIRDVRSVVSALEGMDAVVLLAAVVGDPASTKSPRQTIEINYLASKMIAEAAKYANVNRFLFASTCSVYGVGDAILDENSPLNPVSLYARTKIAAEQAVLSLGDETFKPTIMRLSTLYGMSHRMRFDLVVNVFAMNSVTKGEIEVHGGGTQWRPLVEVRDASDAFIAAIEAPAEIVGNQVFNLGTEEQNYQIKTLAEMAKQVFPHIKMVVNPGTADARDYRVSFEKIRKALSFKQDVTIVQSMREIGEFVKVHLDEDFKSTKYVNQNLDY